MEDQKSCVAYAAEHYPSWQRILRCPELRYGAFGENTVVGQTESAVCIGDVYEIGAVQVSQPRLAGNCLAGASKTWHFKYSRQVEPAGTSEFKGGYVESNLSLILVERPFRSGLLPELIIMHHQLNDRVGC